MSKSPAFEVLSFGSVSPFLLLCDHASNHVPEAVNGGSLGLPDRDMERHIAYDVGAAGVTRRLAEHLGSVAVMSCFSRLVIDPNRGIDDPTLLMRLYDGSIIPANRNVDEVEINRRKSLFYDPYHAAIEAQIEMIRARGQVPHLISIHSFTKKLAGKPDRPWEIGILWDRDGRLAEPLIAALKADGSLCVGDNEPYSGQLQGDCMYRHGTARGNPHVLIEIRNDLIAEEAGQWAWADRLAPLIRPLMLGTDIEEACHG